MPKKFVLGVAAAGVVLTVALAGPAFASEPTSPAPSPSSTPSPTKTGASHSSAPRTLAEIQSAGAAATSKRLTALGTATSKVQADTFLTSSDKSTILATFAKDEAGMKTLATEIAADTTVSAASAHLKSVFSDYRVFAVTLPQARIARTADRFTGTATAKLTTAEKRLAALLSGKDAGKSTAALQADLADMTAQIATITHGTSGLAAAALAVTPSAYDSNHDVLKSSEATAKAVRDAAKKAVSDAKEIRTALRGTKK